MGQGIYREQGVRCAGALCGRFTVQLCRNRKASLLAALERAVEKGIAVVASSQCLRGTVDLRAYELGRRLESIGVISG